MRQVTAVIVFLSVAAVSLSAFLIWFEFVDPDSSVISEDVENSDEFPVVIDIESLPCKDGDFLMSENSCTKEVKWNLSADVMPVPPAGSKDIPDSNHKSKLKITFLDNFVLLKGEMKGLIPDKIYTVFISNGYTPFTSWGGKYPGVEPFDFKTNSVGDGVWEMQVKPVSESTEMSVWVDDVRITLLISDNFAIIPNT